MEYKYHCQPQAESFAKSIIPIPENYPLRDGLPGDFRTHFARLCELAIGIYTDMAKQPEAYGLMLVGIESTDNNLARDGYRSIHRFADTLANLARCGQTHSHQLAVSAAEFKEAARKGHGAVSNPVPKYELILSRLADFGFVISDFDGKPLGKTVASFTGEYPDYPDMSDTIKTYCDCWESIKSDRSSVKVWPGEFHHHFYRFDYKITSELDKIPISQWIGDEAKYGGLSDEIGDFYVAFYEYSLKYKGIKFNGDYNYKSKRIARSLQRGMGISSLSLIIKDMDKYIDEIEKMPDSVKEPFTKNSCNHCGFQGANDEYCKFRRNWTLDNTPHDACAFYGFQFNDFELDRVADYWRLLELDYALEIHTP
jgi:hypothetical protein